MTKLLVILLLVALAKSSSAGTVGVYTHADASGCALELHDGATATVYIVGRTTSADENSGYIVSGEFRIVGLPPNWIAVSRMQPNVHLALGDVFGNGVTFAFAEQQAGVIPLFEVYVHATSEEEDVVLSVARHVNPSPPWGGSTSCAWFQYCDPPCDVSSLCVDGVSLFINAAGCEVAVEQQPWSAVKSLFR